MLCVVMTFFKFKKYYNGDIIRSVHNRKLLDFFLLKKVVKLNCITLTNIKNN